MGATPDGELRGALCHGQRQQHGLQHQRDGAGGADVEMVVSGLYDPRLEAQPLRADTIALNPGTADTYCSIYRRQMLRTQARLGTRRADLLDNEGLGGQQRQGQGAAQDLATPFTERTVDGDHRPPISVCVVAAVGPNAVARQRLSIGEI